MGGGDCHFTQKLAPDLVAESARSAMDTYHHVTDGEAESLCNCGVINSGDVLHLEIMVSRAKSSHFVALASLGGI